MSFGFGVGDFIAALELANKIRKEFAGAPSQFKNISDELRSLSIILQDVDVDLSSYELSDQQQTHLRDIAVGCQNVLTDLGKTVGKYQELECGGGSLSRQVKRAWKRLKFEPEDVRELRERITSNIALLNAFQGGMSSRTVLEVKRGVEQLNRRQDEQDRLAILDWLSLADYAPQQSDFLARRQPGTGQWLLDSTEFKAWVENDKQTLICPGIPGAGKTILTSVVVDEITNYFWGDQIIGIAYLYCNFRQRDEQKVDDLLASLLKQLAQGRPSLPDSVKSLYDTHKEKRTRPSLDEISMTLRSVAGLYSKVFIIVDALDEIPLEERDKFLESTFNLQQGVQACLNIFATSRPEVISHFAEHFEGHILKEIRATDNDILAYVNSRLSTVRRLRISRFPDIIDTIRREITNVADGMFLLAKLHMDHLFSKPTPGDIRDALKNLPRGISGLDLLYDQAMERINTQDEGLKETAKRVLSWIIYARRPLRRVEVQHAVAVRLNAVEAKEEYLSEVEDLISVCAGLVTVDNESGIIRLVHYTTQEYFERTQKQWFLDAEAGIAMTCVTYLSFDVFDSGYCRDDKEFEERLRLNPLYDYAAHNWGIHARKMAECHGSVIDFLEDVAKVEASCQALMAVKRSWTSEYSQDVPKQMTGLHLAAYFGVHEAERGLIHHKQNVDLDDGDGRTPLSYAAAKGHVSVVGLLVEKGAAIEAKGADGWTPLLHAAARGHETVVSLLAEKAADIEAKDTEYGRTSLSYAVANGHVVVVQLLLEKGANTEAKDNFGRLPLLYAAANGRTAIMRVLLSQETTDIETQDNFGRTSLWWAAANGQEAVVRLLLNSGADTETKSTGFSNAGRTPLSFAATNGHEAVVRLLLEKGADIETKDDKYGQTPLAWATENGHETIVQLLVDKGANTGAKDNSGRTPLSRAAEGGHDAIVRLLLEKGVNVDEKSTRRYDGGRTPLWYAAENGHEAAARLLLDAGATIDVGDNLYGWTPLCRAAWKGHEAVVQLLLDKNADVEAKDGYGRTPLSCAAMIGHEAVVLLLLDAGADIDAKDHSGQTPLSYAAANSHDTIVQLLKSKK